SGHLPIGSISCCIPNAYFATVHQFRVLERMPLSKPKKPVRPKAGTKPVAGKSGKQQPKKKDDRPAKPPPPPPQSTVQFDAFERAIELLNKRNFREAKELFEKATEGPNREMVSKAALHIRMCARRLSA